MGGTGTLTREELARTREELAGLLLAAGAVEIRTDPERWFTWTSGRRAPIYCDNRILISFPRERTLVVDALVACARERFAGAQVIAGTATAGIPWAAWLAERLALPLVYVRGAAKEHGRGRRVEGRELRGERTLLVEDMVSYGGSSLSAADALEAEGGKLVGVLAIVSWDFPETTRRFAERGLPLAALVDYQALVARLKPDPATARVLLEWRES